MFLRRKLLQFTSILVVLTILFSGFPRQSALAQGKDGLKRQVNPQTGRVSFLGPESGSALSASQALGIGPFSHPADPALALAKRFGSEFGLTIPERELSQMKTHRAENGRIMARYQQNYQGIPVIGGELIVNTNDNGDLYSMNGEVSPDLSLSTQPTLDSEQAKQTALQAAAKWYQKTSEDFQASEPELWIYDESLLRPSTRPAELVWRMEVTPKDIGTPVRELVLVNAQRGSLSLHFNQIDTAWSLSGKTNAAQDIQPTSTPQPTETPPTETPEPSVTAVPTEETNSTEDVSASNALTGEIGPLAATTWYVATTGNNSNSCTSAGSPCQTINAAMGKAAASGDTIKVAIGTYTGTGAQVVLINKSITLSGGWNASFTTQSGTSIVDGQGVRRGVTSTEHNVIIDYFTIQNGFHTTEGGGIYTYGSLTLNSALIINNSAYNGAGIYSINPLIGDNTIINNSTISNNIGFWGGGIYQSGLLTLNNTTISNNSAPGGGGIYNHGDLTLKNATVSYNSASNGGGILQEYGQIILQNSILALNTVVSEGPDCYGAVGSSGYNLIGNNSGCTFTATTGDLVNVNARLGLLIGFPGYIPLLSGSPAIDAGNPAISGSGGNACLATDERGVTRPVGIRCDIGAYEYTVPGSATSLFIVSGNNQHAGPNLAFVSPLRVAILDSQGSPVSNVNVTFTAPGSGASGIFTATGTRTMSAISDTNGIATTSTFVANALLGSYTVTASANGVGPINFNLQNTAWYVSTTGNDSNSCTLPGSPCATINAAIGKAAVGDAILIATGIYTGAGTEVVLINKSITLSGGWNASFTAQSGTSTIDGQTSRRGITVNLDISATIERFTIQNGYWACCEEGGGGIYNLGSLILNNSKITNSSAYYRGGGIYNRGILTINNGTISNNTTTGYNGSGGGIVNNMYNPGSGILTLNNSTVSGNSEGGINNGNIATLNNSTISGNSAIGSGGGISTSGELTINNSTIVNNSISGGSGGGGGGIYHYSGNLSIQNSIVANNSSWLGPDCSSNPNGPGVIINSKGYNLVGNNSYCNINSTTGDQIGTNTNRINPHLAPLQDNGGPTFTHALMAGSPAIDTGNPAVPGSGGNACLAADQRGVARPVSTRCDPGAYEGSVPWTLAPFVDTYTAHNYTSLPGTFLCDQSDPTCTAGDSHAKAAHKYAIGTYNFYATQFNRDSLDNNGMTIISVVHYSYGYDNSYWDGEQMIFGDKSGWPLADDVVAHEFTHGVTQYESNLFYYYQSGAINESFSDLWGEYYDQTNGLGTDTPAVKWKISEDILPSGAGAIRDMSNPPALGDPDKMSSPNYYEGEEDDGGVHYNSGVNNKAVFLMVDGGTFNGKTVTALGWDKTAAIYYEVNTNLLSSGADYSDLYYALQQACTNLIGQKGITAGDCTEVKDAIDAVEMYAQPAINFNIDAPYCDAGNPVTTVFSDDLEAGTGNWTLSNGTYPRWQWDSPYGSYAQSGAHFLYADDYPAAVTDATARLASFVVPNNAYLRFAQAFDFETSDYYYDGGVLEYSINGGSTWLDAGSLMDANGYRGTIFNNYNNPLKGRSAFVGSSHGYISTRLNLYSLVGQTVSFRWRMGLDGGFSAWGWWVDNIKVYTCPVILGKDTTGVFRPSNGLLYLKNSNTTGFADIAINYGMGGDYPVVGDWDGDGDATIGIYRNGKFYLRNSNTIGFADLVFAFGTPGDQPIAGDWNGDGIDTIGVYRPSIGQFLLRNNNSAGPEEMSFYLGNVGDVGIAGDWNGDGMDTTGVFRPVNGIIFLKNTNTTGFADIALNYGIGMMMGSTRLGSIGMGSSIYAIPTRMGLQTSFSVWVFQGICLLLEIGILSHSR